MQEAIKPNFESDKNPYTQHPRTAQKIVGHELAKDKFVTSYKSGKLHHAWLIFPFAIFLAGVYVSYRLMKLAYKF